MHVLIGTHILGIIQLQVYLGVLANEVVQTIDGVQGVLWVGQGEGIIVELTCFVNLLFLILYNAYE